MTEARITAETMMRERRDTWLKSIFSKGDLMMIDMDFRQRSAS